VPRRPTLSETAVKNLRSEANQLAIRAGVILFVALTVGAVVDAASFVIAIGLMAGGILVAIAYAWGALRARKLVGNLPEQPERVQVAGWTRTPDGTNYAIWPAGADSRTQEPAYVLRLSTAKKQTGSGEALLLGPVSPRRSAALVGADGEILGVGGMRSAQSAARAWARRGDAAPWWTGPGGRAKASA
jgi:hypothetical protein